MRSTTLTSSWSNGRKAGAASCEYNTDLYEVATIRRLLGQFQNLLEGITANPACRLSDFALTRRVAADLQVTPPSPYPLPQRTGGEGRVPESVLDACVAPRDAVEAKLAELWEGVLGIRGIGVTADFFDVGGHSLRAAQLLARVEKAFGRKVPLAGLPAVSHDCRVSGPTPEGASKRCARLNARRSNRCRESGGGSVESPEQQVFPMHRAGTRPPLLIVDAGPFQRPFVRRLGGEQPIWGLALPELSALPKGFTVADIATNLVQALERSAIDGPYHLAGWSQAGIIAYEIAQQLLVRGKKVASLILFDAASPSYLRSFEGWGKLPMRLYLWLERSSTIWGGCGMPWGEVWQYFRERMHGFQPERMAKRQRSTTQGEETSTHEFIEAWQVQYLAADKYEPEPCDWPVVLVRSQVLQTGWFRDPHLGWGKLARAGCRCSRCRENMTRCSVSRMCNGWRRS